MRRFVTVLSFMLLTASCQMLPKYTPKTVKELLPIGSKLQLLQSLEIPADRSFIYIANGKVAPLKNYNSVDIYQPYCMFRLNKESAAAQIIMPGTFEVTRIIEWEGYHGGLNGKIIARPGRFNNGFIKTGGVEYDPGPSTIMYATILSLRSRAHPDVKELVCGHWDDQGIVEPLTLDEMKSALGQLIIIKSGGTAI